MASAVHPYFDHPRPLAIAHRGGVSDHPENTLPAFRSAVDMGYRYLETDVHLTADGQIVAFHDDQLDRVTDSAGAIADRTLAELSTVEVGRGGRIPTLAALLTELPDVRWNIDPKSDAVVDALIDTLREYDAFDRVCLGAFSDSRLDRCRQLAGPALATSLGPRDVARLVAATRTRRLRRRLPQFAGHAAQVPVRQGRIAIVDERFVDTAHACGLQVHVWTIDDPDEMHALFDIGVDAVMTDRPATLKDVLLGRGSWHFD